MPHQRFGVVVEPLREVQLPLQDVLVDHQRVVVGEGVDPRNHLVDQHPQRPPVHRLTVALVLQDLGRQVLGRPAEGEGAILDCLGEAEVCQFEVSVSGDEDVLRLQVAVDDVPRVQVLEDGDDVCGVEAG